MHGFQRVKPLSFCDEAAFVGGTLCAALFLWRMDGFGGMFFQRWLFFAFLWRISLLDWRHGLVFDRLVLPFGVIGIAFSLFSGALPPENFVFAAFLAGGFLYLLRLVSRGGMGGGDVKLGFALGLWLGLEGVALALFLAFFSGGLAAFCLLLFGREKRGRRIVFAPFLALGAVLSLLFADDLLAFYGGLL